MIEVSTGNKMPDETHAPLPTDAEFSVRSLIGWLETQPADKEYDWMEASKCLLGQWCQSKGLCGDGLHDKSVELGESDVFYKIALRDIHRCTFGAALKRARAALAEYRGGVK